jgi:hypothetical protein
MIKIRTNFGCVCEPDIIKMKDFPKFDVDVHALNTTLTRKMVKIYVKEKAMYADIITGTLYDPKTGKSSSSRLWIEKVYKP